MRIGEKVVVVTGGGSGIGAALCRRFSAEGASGVVVADLDFEAAKAVAAELDALPIQVDVASEAQVQQLVEQTQQAFGPIDLFCANAGINPGLGLGLREGGPFAADDVWLQSWQVNVMAHVYSARAVLPGMLERGEGYWMSTASAAGLLTDFVAHAYSVTKHAAVAFAEWLAVAYGDAGLKVSCLCPMGVQTPLLKRVEKGGLDAHVADSALTPDDVAEAVVQGLDAERFLILPHREVESFFRAKGEDYDAWLKGMRKLRERLFS